MMLSQLSGTTKLDLFDDRAEIELSAHAAVIKALGKRVVADVIEIGARLAKCKQIIESDGGYAAWLAWLDHEFKWDEKTARNFLNVHAFVEQKSGNFPDVSVSAIYLLAAPSTPESARDAVLDLAANGEHMTHAQVKQMIADAKKETADNYERRIATLTKRYEEQEARLREDLASLPALDLEKTITEALAPLQDKIKRLEDERRKQHDAKPKRADPHGRAATGIINSLHYLVAELSIDAQKFVEHQTIVADATSQTLEQVMAEFLRDARTAQTWLTTLFDLMEVKS